ncbi:hypothetical protein LWF15_31700 [Kineosporia rhizophila]|uniref:hypothetical protein n=1 Tax=Kineosporia rhizophila TaxID=84633 RepID=UPI001E538CFF|nr:hypothetical protein [Kineosporia rhizophila]MCE0540068.1 hypothetical protein [Kineosporia rhizophila]
MKTARVAAALAPALLLALTACGAESTPQNVTGATAGPAGVADPSASADDSESSTTSPAESATDDSPMPADGGCPEGGGKVPAKAAGAQVGDLDGDGAKDELWLADNGNKRRLGVRTASGRVMSTVFQSGSPQSAVAVANRLGDGSAIILLSTGRTAALYAVIDCEIVATKDKTGGQYTFDLGFGSYGTGVACPMANDKLYLAGYLATAAEREGYENITRTRIDLSEEGARADNGTVAELGEHGNDSASAKIAHGVSCGDSGTAEEPVS